MIFSRRPAVGHARREPGRGWRAGHPAGRAQDAGDRAEVVWHRDDVSPLTPPAWPAAARPTPWWRATRGLSLLVFNPADGHTLNSYPLPGADGFPVGVSVGNDRRVVATTSAGQVYSLAPAQKLKRRQGGARHRRGGGAGIRGQQLTLAEEEDHRIVGDGEVLVVRRVHPVPGEICWVSPVWRANSRWTIGNTASIGLVPGANSVSRVTGRPWAGL